MSGDWYGQIQIDSIVSGVETTNTFYSCPTSGFVYGFPSVEYEPQIGYKLVASQKRSECGTSQNAAGGVDVITITLSSLIADPVTIPARRSSATVSSSPKFSFTAIVRALWATIFLSARGLVMSMFRVVNRA